MVSTEKKVNKQTKNSVIDWEQCPVIKKNSLTKVNFTFAVAKDEIHPTCFGHTSE